MEQRWRSRITSDPGIFGGKPIIRGMRIRVIDILDLLAAGETREVILEDYPYLEDEDITAALEYSSQALPSQMIAAE
jgi:uncharacterized protein (DUF433 family)